MATAVRLADYGDLDRAAELAAELAGGASDPTTWRSVLEDDIRRDDRCLFVAESGHTLLGQGRVRWFEPADDAPADSAPSGYYLSGVGVHPRHRRHGIGRRLTVARMEWVAGRQEVVWFFTEDTNTASIELHCRLGFREVTRDFSYPGVVFGDTGVLFQAML